MESLEENLKLEDYKATTTRIETLEDRFTRIVFFCVTTFGIVIGLSAELGKETEWLLSIVMASLIWISSYMGLTSRILQGMHSAYLLKEYDKKYLGLKKEEFYNHYEQMTNSKTSNNNEDPKQITFRRIYTSPFSTLWIIAVLAEIYFIRQPLSQVWESNFSILTKDIGISLTFALYLILIVYLNILTVSKIKEYVEKDYFYFQGLFDEAYGIR